VCPDAVGGEAVDLVAHAAAVPTAVVVQPAGPDGPVDACNDALRRLLGLAPGDPVPAPAQFIERRSRPSDWPDPDGPPVDAVLRRADGTPVPVRVWAATVRAGGARLLVLQFVDQRPLLAVEQARRELEVRFRRTFDQAPVGMAVADEHLVVTEVNAALGRFLGRSCESLAGRDLAELLHPDDRAAATARLRAAVDRGEAAHRTRTRHLRPDGTTVWGDLNVAVERTAEGAAHQFVVHLVDATDAHRREDELRQHSREDPLTRLLNRRALFEAYAELQPGPGAAEGLVAVLFCDLDRFKEVNDVAGHHVGDELLRLVARRVHHTVRPSDRLARLGGDEFVLVCRVAEPADAMAFARRIVRCFDEPFHVGEGRYRLAVSVGVAVAPAGADPHRHVAAADAAMYVAKRGGEPISVAPDWSGDRTGRAEVDLRTDPTTPLELPMAPDTPAPGHDTPTGTDPDARYDTPGYEDKSLGQAVNSDAELVDELVEESGGDLEAAERRFEQESAGAPALARQGGGAGGSVEEADRRNGEPGAGG
jgi:diguanylate cyclase (GGDEF)-like protein/PAS domain S-box-containing protein